MEIDITKLTIKELFPNIFERQYFFVYPNDMVYLACTCLIPTIEVYIDGVIVIENNRPIGRVGTKHILSAYYRYGKEAFYKKVREIMKGIETYIKPDTLFKDLIDDIKNSRLGFVPIVNNGMISVVSIYDILRVLLKSRMNEPIGSLGSRIIMIDNNSSIRDALNMMVERNIRRLFIREGDEIYSINDRCITEFVLTNEVMENKNIDISTLHIDLIKKHKTIQIKPDTTIKDVIVLLLKQQRPSSLVTNGHVVTPFDIIMNVKYK